MGTRKCRDKDIYPCGFEIGVTFCLRPCPVLFGAVTCPPSKNCHRAQRRRPACRLTPHGARVILRCSGKGKLYKFCPADVGRSQVRWCQVWRTDVPWKRHRHCCLRRGGMSNCARELRKRYRNGDLPSLLSKLSASDSDVLPGIGFRCATSAPGGDGGWCARLAEAFHTNSRPVELPSMALPG